MNCTRRWGIRSALIALLFAAMPLAAQQSPVDSIGRLAGAAVERDTVSVFSPSRLASLPAARRAEWTAYLARSRALKAADQALIAGELRATGQRRMTRAPYVRQSFEVTRAMDEAWFRGDSARRMAETILSFQTPSGGWSKHVDMRAAPRRPGQSFFSESDGWQYIATLDNNATTAELRFLALAERAGPDPRFRAAFVRGVEYLLAAQFPNGCWPQVYPLQGGYHDAATFNDDATANAAALLRDVGRGDPAFVPAALRRRAEAAAARAIECILAAQVVSGGKRTIWGQQHDPLTLAPIRARSYEPASLATRESAGILRLLMQVPDPDARVVAAVHSAAAWFREHRIFGYTYDFSGGRREQPGAGPLWARMVEVGTNRPIFSNRDGVILYDYERLTDRRTGYGWYSEEPAGALKAYDRWARAHPAPATTAVLWISSTWTMTNPSELSRRDFLRAAAFAGAGLMLPTGAAAGCASLGGRSAGTGWDAVPGILARIRPPSFPARDFVITRYGAVGNGTSEATRAIAAAVDACAAAGGGRVVVPEGRFLTGPVHLKSGVDLHVEAGATLAFVRDPRAYLPAVFTRWEGMEMMGYSPLIYAFEQENVAITGRGTLDGQASETFWWPWKGAWKQHPEWDRGPTQKAARDRLMQMVEAGTPVERRVFAQGSNLRPQFIQPYRCRNVLIEGVTIINSPMWEINPVLCRNVTVRGVTVNTHGPNNDGCNPESCSDVLIEGCTFDTGDDCIAIKSGRNADGRRIAVPSENIVIRGCRMKDGHGGVTLGSEISGHVRNVFVERCEMDSPNLDRALRFKNNAMRGGILEHVYMRDVTIGQVKDSVLSVDLYYEEAQAGPFTPVVRDVEMRNVTSRKSRYGLYMRAYPRSEISDIRIVDSRFDGVERGNVAEGVRGLRFAGSFINGQPATATSHAAAFKTDADRLPSDVRTREPASSSAPVQSRP